MHRKLRLKINKGRLDRLFAEYNKREYVHPDPLEFLYDYNRLEDREIAGLVASCLAYGRVAQILKSTSLVLGHMQPSPYAFLMKSSKKSLLSLFSGFKHRFTTGEQMASMLWSIRKAIKKHGSLNRCFLSYLEENDLSIIPALSYFVGELFERDSPCRNFLVPSPDRGSACKRLNLYLRWMVRHDDVDPGGWEDVPASKLIIPLDVHMHRIGRMFNMTERKQADLKAALEITNAFKELSPEDPVKYDFALTRFGIRDDMDFESLAII